jgi:hypothetical protein
MWRICRFQVMVRMLRLCKGDSDNVKNIQTLCRLFSQCEEYSYFSDNAKKVQTFQKQLIIFRQCIFGHHSFSLCNASFTSVMKIIKLYLIFYLHYKVKKFLIEHIVCKQFWKHSEHSKFWNSLKKCEQNMICPNIFWILLGRVWIKLNEWWPKMHMLLWLFSLLSKLGSNYDTLFING